MGKPELMCSVANLQADIVSDDKDVPNWVQCPVCKRRMKPRVFECGDVMCFHILIPPHKKKGWHRKPKQIRKMKTK